MVLVTRGITVLRLEVLKVSRLRLVSIFVKFTFKIIKRSFDKLRETMEKQVFSADGSKGCLDGTVSEVTRCGPPRSTFQMLLSFHFWPYCYVRMENTIGLAIRLLIKINCNECRNVHL